MNINTFSWLNFVQSSPAPANTETIVLATNHQSDTVRANSMVGIRADLAGGFFDGHPVRVRVTGKGTVANAENVTVKVRFNSGANTNLTTFTGDSVVLSTGTMAGASSNFSFYASSVVLWDSVSQQLAAFTESGGLLNIPTTPAVVGASAAIAGTNPTKTSVSLPIQFFVTAQFATGGAGDSLVVTELALDQI